MDQNLDFLYQRLYGRIFNAHTTNRTQRLYRIKFNKMHLDLTTNVIGIDLVEGDNLLDLCLPIRTIDLVIHLAGKSGVRESINDPAGYWMNNIEASRRLFERYQDTRILYASSSSAYEPDLNPYAASKYVLEELAERYPNTLGMRFHTVWSHNPRKGMFFDKLFNGELEYVTRHYRDFVHLLDVIDAINILIECDYVKGVLDIGSGVPVRVQDLVNGPSGSSKYPG